MSIFQAKDWWSTTVGDNEEFDQNSICISNIDNDQEIKEDKIIVGSFEGKLRIYKPNRKKNHKYHVEDLTIEKNMGYPILQVGCGNFSKNHQGLCLAILSTRVLTIHYVESNTSFSKINEISSHKLERNAFNFIHGYFGNENSKNEQICVQSIDGALYFIDYDSVMFKIQLADYLIPGPFLFANESKSVIISNSNLEIECYNFHSMKAFTNNDLDKQKENQAKDEKKSKLDPTWITNIGEQPRQMKTHENKYLKQCDIIVLGEQSLFIMNEHGGKIRFQKRFQFTPSTILTYHLKGWGEDLYEPEKEGGDMQAPLFNKSDLFKDKKIEKSKKQITTPGFMSLIGNFEGYLNVYKDIKLAWTTKLQSVPIYVNTAQFQNKQGLIVTMSDSGELQICYLGTDQLSQADLGKLHQTDQEIDYQLMDQKHKQIVEQIKAQESEQSAIPQDGLQINLQLSQNIEECNEYLEDPQRILARNPMGQLFRMKLKVTISYQYRPGQISSGTFRNVQVDIKVPFGVQIDRQVLKYEQLNMQGSSTPQTEQIFIYAQNNFVPNELELKASLSYQQIRTESNSNPQSNLFRTSLNDSVKIPSSFFMRVIEPQKENLDSKILMTMVGDQTLKSLPDLFSDMFDLQKCDESFKQRRNLSVQYHNEEIASVLVSKDEKKIRIQTSQFYQQWLILREFIEKIQDSNSGKHIHEIIQIDQNIPTNELFELIDEHFSLKKEEQNIRKVLEQHTVQFRMIQKRLINRFKDKNPSPLNNLDFLLNHTYDQIIEMAIKIEKIRVQISKVSNQLSCTLESILLLLKIKAKLPYSEYETLRQFISPHIDDYSETCWEDITFTGIQYLIKSSFANQNQGAVQSITSSQIQALQDCTKLKKNIQSLFDKLVQLASKGEKVHFVL